ncbi:pilus assembly protein TadG-related protein [Micrococcus sp.]|uniref:pilus assembly protein TadG-related protein n=1 Tax=Micrococcus sp. TaxID=1271 RepID=UPI002A91E804|nr:pilus assembly protein TadG-related protein [Micrococcus sp.]MDY6055083.1 pilus assembly protein TadG-related protein [Micrococcus sp.]
MTRQRRPAAEEGQTTVLTVGLSAVLIALVLVLFAVTTVQIQARKVQSLADGAALAGAEELGFQLDAGPGVVLDPHAVQDSVTEHLAAVGARSAVPGLGDVRTAVAADGTTVDVRIEARVPLVPTGGWLAGVIPVSVPVSAEGSSRTALTR